MAVVVKLMCFLGGHASDMILFLPEPASFRLVRDYSILESRVIHSFGIFQRCAWRQIIAFAQDKKSSLEDP